MKFCLITAAFLLISVQAASADIAVRFDEGAPKDRFTFENTSTCAIRSAQMTLDLTPSRGGLIFDVTAAGEGVEVYQPLEITDGKQTLSAVPRVADGDKVIVFDIKQMDAGAKLSFTIDVDDTKGGREITVTDSEIDGAKVMFSSDGKRFAQTFDGDARALVKTNLCS